MKLKNLAFALSLISTSVAFAQEEQANPVDALNQRVTLLEDAKTVGSKLKVSGYVQAQWESTEKDGSLKVGESRNANLEKDKDMNRFGIRRGRIKVGYDDKEIGVSGALQFDMTEKGMFLKDAYMQVLDPWVGYASLKGGIYDRPFGYEISYSSSRRESPERSRIFQTLFPDERDLGFMLILQAPKTSPWNVLKLEAGLFAGNGIYKDIDSKKDFIGHLSYSKSFGDTKVGLGVSLYEGFVAQTTANVYSMSADSFKVDNTASNKNKFAKREYIGFDGQVSTSSFLGLTTLRAEFITGTQPGTSGSSSSPKKDNLPGFDKNSVATADPAVDIYGGGVYLRKFQGGYIHLVQDILDTKHSVEVKYDWYDPNTKVSADRIGQSAKTGKADIAYSTLGLGYLYRMNANVRLMVYYDMNTNETSTKLSGYGSDKKDNVFTVRFQYKF